MLLHYVQKLFVVMSLVHDFLLALYRRAAGGRTPA